MEGEILVVFKPNKEVDILDWQSYGWTSQFDGASYHNDSLNELSKAHNWIIRKVGPVVCDGRTIMMPNSRR